MQNLFLSLFPIIMLILAGVFVPWFYLHQSNRGERANKFLFDQSSRLLAALILVAFLSIGLFVFILIFNFLW